MGVKSKLSETTWQEIGRRYLAGEGSRALGREFEIGEGAIRKRFSTQGTQVKKLANTLAATELQISNLPIGTQIAVRTMADSLKIISGNLLDGAAKGAILYNHFKSVALSKKDMVSADGELDEEATKQIAGLIRVATLAAEVPLQLVKASKEINEAGAAAKDADEPIGKVIYEVANART